MPSQQSVGSEQTSRGRDTDAGVESHTGDDEEDEERSLDEIIDSYRG